MNKLFVIALLIFCQSSFGQMGKLTENIVLVTFDGLRWQEVFKGADTALLHDKVYTKSPEKTTGAFWKPDYLENRKTLLPFFWNTIATQGQLYGNRTLGNQVNVTNQMWFSYPGYNEILCGFADDKNIHSNDKILNPNTTVLEYLNNLPAYKGKVVAFTSWDVFPFIINQQRSGVLVNAANEPLLTASMGDHEKFMNGLVSKLPEPWDGIRYDGLTFSYALEYLKREKPKVTFISFDETDDYAHDGKYDQYLKAAQRTDGFIKELWEYLQSDPQYKGKTTLILTTDHGRGETPKETWKHHGKEVKDADQIWMAVMGPDTPARGEMKTKGTLYQNQVAATIAAMLKVSYTNTPRPGSPVREAFK